MNEVTTQHSAQKAVLVSGAAVAGLVPTTIEEVFRLASAVHKAGLAPYGLETPEKLTIAIMTGLEVGLPPMQAVQSIAVINNRPTIWGDGLMAIVRKSPVCLYIREWIEGEGDSMVAYCETHRRGEPAPVVRTFSVDDARRARLWQTEARVTKRKREGGTYETDNDSPWYRFPKRMLQMRSRALCIRDVYADITRGIQVREEVEDYPAREPRDVTPQPEQSPALARIAAARASQTVDTSAEITDHVARETAAMDRREAVEDAEFDEAPETNEPAGHAGYDDGEPAAGGEAEGNGAEGSSLSPEPIDVDMLERFSAALMRATSVSGLKAHSGDFWAKNGGAPEKGTRLHEVAARVWRQHDARIGGAIDVEGCRAAVDQIIGEVA